MAAIDKLYVHSWYEYDDLRRWAMAYYPELLFYFYDIDIKYKDWENNVRAYVDNNMDIAKRDFKKLGPYSSKAEAEYNLKKYYKKTANYDCPTEQAIDEVNYIIEAYMRKTAEWEELYFHPITSTPLSVDRKLKWICPVPCVRKYLHEQCGVSQKWEWLYKIFWKGKKHF